MENQNDGRLPLLGMSLTELQSLTARLGEAKFRGQQLANTYSLLVLRAL